MLVNAEISTTEGTYQKPEDAARRTDPSKMHRRGKGNALAVFEYYSSVNHVNLDAETQNIIVAGFSAGTGGITSYANEIAEILKGSNKNHELKNLVYVTDGNFNLNPMANLSNAHELLNSMEAEEFYNHKAFDLKTNLKDYVWLDIQFKYDPVHSLIFGGVFRFKDILDKFYQQVKNEWDFKKHYAFYTQSVIQHGLIMNELFTQKTINDKTISQILYGIVSNKNNVYKHGMSYMEDDEYDLGDENDM